MPSHKLLSLLRNMSGCHEEELWGKAAEACARLATALPADEPLDEFMRRQFCEALDELAGLPASAPPAGFVR